MSKERLAPELSSDTHGRVTQAFHLAGITGQCGCPVLRVLCEGQESEMPAPVGFSRWAARRCGPGRRDITHKVVQAASPPTLAKTQGWGTLGGNGAHKYRQSRGTRLRAGSFAENAKGCPIRQASRVSDCEQTARRCPAYNCGAMSQARFYAKFALTLPATLLLTGCNSDEKPVNEALRHSKAGDQQVPFGFTQGRLSCLASLARRNDRDLGAEIRTSDGKSISRES
jgi:hypothetical protein